MAGAGAAQEGYFVAGKYRVGRKLGGGSFGEIFLGARAWTNSGSRVWGPRYVDRGCAGDIQTAQHMIWTMERTISDSEGIVMVNRGGGYPYVGLCVWGSGKYKYGPC